MATLLRLGRTLQCSRPPRAIPTLLGSRSCAAWTTPQRLFHATGLRTGQSSPTSGNDNIIQFRLADIGEGITECELLQWFVKEGATIAQFDRICEVQSDKATVEITSRYDGVISKLHYAAGDVAKVGAPLIDIVPPAGADKVDSPVKTAPPPVETTAAPPPPPSTATAKTKSISFSVEGGDAVFATPAVRRIAKEMNVNLSDVTGTGKDTRITKEDILNHVAGTCAKSPPAAGSHSVPAAGSVKQAQVTPLSPIQKAMVKAMERSLQIPHFGFSDQFSLKKARELRDDLNRHLAKNPHTLAATTVHKISFMPLFIKSFSMALKQFPLLNAQFVPADGAQAAHLLYRPSHNIAIAMDTPAGLVVPNIQQVEQKSVLEIAAEMARLNEQAQSGSLPPAAFQNATITISNIGNIGGIVLSPVIPPDTVCIAAIGRSQIVQRLRQAKKVSGEDESSWGKDAWKVDEDEVVTVSFSADHRVVDGATVARFFVEWRRLLEFPGRMVMDMK